MLRWRFGMYPSRSANLTVICCWLTNYGRGEISNFRSSWFLCRTSVKANLLTLLFVREIFQVPCHHTHQVAKVQRFQPISLPALAYRCPLVASKLHRFAQVGSLRQNFTRNLDQFFFWQDWQWYMYTIYIYTPSI